MALTREERIARDIIIPDIEIDHGWPVSDIETLEDCDDAFAFLTEAIAKIETALDIEALKPFDEQRGEWQVKTRCALKYKKAAMTIVNNKRHAIVNKEKIAREEARLQRHHAGIHNQKILDMIKLCVSREQFAEWVRMALGEEATDEAA